MTMTTVHGPPLICACGHGIVVHWSDAGGCQKCSCSHYTRPVTKEGNRP